MINILPQPILFSIGPVQVHWYGIAYAVGLAATYWVVEREARRRKLDISLLVNGFIVVAIAALIGGRAYHVIDQWHYYQDHLPQIVLPPYTGLGVYGGIVTGFIAGIAYARWKGQRVSAWADAAAPGILVMQAIGRWGNFFNQELYGPPTKLPWGIAIDCAHRTATWARPPVGTTPADTFFQPLFLYESLSGLIGAIVLLRIFHRNMHRMRPLDLTFIVLIWYAITRFVLEPLRTNNWTFFGVPTAMVVSAAFILVAGTALVLRHRRPGPSVAEADAADEARLEEARQREAREHGAASTSLDPGAPPA